MINIQKTNQRGQSTVEYILLVTAVVTVLILLLTSDGSLFKQHVKHTYGNATESMTGRADKLVAAQDDVVSTAPKADPDPSVKVDPTKGFNIDPKKSLQSQF